MYVFVVHGVKCVNVKKLKKRTKSAEKRVKVIEKEWKRVEKVMRNIHFLRVKFWVILQYFVIFRIFSIYHARIAYGDG